MGLCILPQRGESLNKKMNPQIRIYLNLVGKLQVLAYITLVYTQVSTLDSEILQACKQCNMQLWAHVMVADI